MANPAIDPIRTALLVIDMQNDFLAPGAPIEAAAGREIIPALQRLLARCRDKGLLIVFTAFVHRPGGSDVEALWRRRRSPVREGRALVAGTTGVGFYPEIAPQPGDLIVEKHRYSAFFGTDLEILLRGKGVDTVIIGGVCTDLCCESTARDAMFRDYRVIFLSDGNATFEFPDLGFGAIPHQEAHRCALARIAAFFGTVMSVEEVLARVGE